MIGYRAKFISLGENSSQTSNIIALVLHSNTLAKLIFSANWRGIQVNSRFHGL